jgi:uncharacterized membrane protein YjgN (DUF898 family)
LKVIFNGKGFEYFKIWIVNIFLTILTLGIYSAWAKVRNKQYFYGNTVIDGSSFSYTAKPVTILKGRIIAVVIFLIYNMASQFFPFVGLALALVFLGFIPWLVVRSLVFNSRNSVYRNIRFNFHGTTMGAAKTFLLWPILVVPTLGLIIPFIWFKKAQYFVPNSAYGTARFDFHARAGDYYRIFFITLGILILTIVAILGIFSASFGTMMLDLQSLSLGQVSPLMMIVTQLIVLSAYLYIFGYLMAALSNLYFNSTTLGQHGFSSQLKAGKITWIYLTNTMAIVLSLGLLIPWAKVRMMIYRADCLQLNVRGSLDNFIADELKHVSALGEEVGEVFDMDIGVL